MFSKDIDARAPIHQLIASRWSGRAYDRERFVSDQHIASLLEAARWAPSCYGDQPWRYLVCNRKNNKVAWEKALSCLVEGNRSWAQNAPLFLLACANTILSKDGTTMNHWGEYDTGAASENLSLQATALNLMVHQMAGFDKHRAQAIFEVPSQFKPMSMISIGHQLAEAEIPSELKEREYQPRMRNALSQNFFDGHWGKLLHATK